ncbi:MAG: hypothetical protein HYU33_02690, partial [Candidatus Omnitrophica bacterium]|nr:hypothetical protein [Candidatus Omnitrophota bacterium]
MLELANDLDSPQTLVYVQEEPALEIALPQVFEQPPLVALVRGKLSNVEGLISFIFRRHNENPEGVLGSEYQELVLEFQPLFSWSVACWDYLLSTEGCRFIPRVPSQKIGARGDYRAFTDKDYSRMVHAMFRSCVLEFAQRPLESSFSEWLRGRFWLRISEAYQQLSIPRD